jgi:hypothetical protein
LVCVRMVWSLVAVPGIVVAVAAAVPVPADTAAVVEVVSSMAVVLLRSVDDWPAVVKLIQSVAMILLNVASQ